MYKSLRKIALRDTIGTSRTDVGISTIISREDIHIEADFSAGRIGDAFVWQKSKTVDGKGGEWQFVAAIPTGNIKSYELSVSPKMELVPGAESQAANPSPAAGRS